MSIEFIYKMFSFVQILMTVVSSLGRPASFFPENIGETQ